MKLSANPRCGNTHAHRSLCAEGAKPGQGKPVLIMHIGFFACFHAISLERSRFSKIAGLASVVVHRMVNHSIHFVDPTTGVHTQHVESYWNRVKVKLKHMRGCHAQQIPGYLDEFMWRERHGRTGQAAFTGIIGDIAQQYPIDFVSRS